MLARRVGGKREAAWLDLVAYNSEQSVREYWSAIEVTASQLDERKVLPGSVIQQNIERMERTRA